MTVTMDSSDRLLAVLRRAARRLSLQSALHAGITAGAVVTGVLVMAAVVSLIVPLSPIPFARSMAAVFSTVVLITAVLVLARPTSLLDAARLLDLRAGLEERSSTALEVTRRPTAGPLGRRVIEDAVSHLEPLSLARVFPTRLPRSAWIVVGLVLLVWPQALRGVAIPGTPAARVQQTIRREGGRLEQFARELQSRTRTAPAPQTRRTAPRLGELGRRLQQERVDRAEALARIAELSRQIEETRREIGGRLEAQRPAGRQGIPEELFRRQALQQQIRQLRELTTRLQQSPGASQDVLQRLAESSQSLPGDQPAQVRQALKRAREELQQGRAGSAGEALSGALRELEGLESMLADAEGLRTTQQHLQQSRQAIASGGGAAEAEVPSEETGSPPRQVSPGENAPSSEAGAGMAPPEGPHEGTAPGQGAARDKMGAPSPRRQGERTPERLRGAQSEGAVSFAEVIGAGRPGAALQTAQRASASIVAQADQAMEQARTPGRYRALVRRYFQALARLR